MSQLIIPQKNVAAWVADMAKNHGVSDKTNSMIALGDTITGLSGDDVKLDSFGVMLVYLKEKGVLTGENIIQIKYAQLKENKFLNKNRDSGYEL